MAARATADNLLYSSKHEGFNQCGLNVGPASQTIGQHSIDVGLIYRVRREMDPVWKLARRAGMCVYIWLSTCSTPPVKTRCGPNGFDVVPAS